jgi:hypothetical protein
VEEQMILGRKKNIEIVYYYYKETGHTKRYYRKLQIQNQRTPTATVNVATSNSSSENTVTIWAVEYTKFQNLLKESTSAVTIAEASKQSVVSSSNKWVIDSGATNHMTGNPQNFFSFEKYNTLSSVTIVDGTTYTIKGFGTIKTISFITLSFALSLPNLAFNLISMSKLTKDLNYYVSFFPDHCLFQDLMTKQAIGKRYISNGLSILDA